MTTVFQTKKITLNEAFQEKAAKKLQKLDRFFDDATATIKVSSLKDKVVMELTVKYNSLIFRAESMAVDKFDALDDCVDTIIRQIRKNKTKLEKRLHQGGDLFVGFEDDVEETDSKVVKVKRFIVKPMDVEEAILEMEMLGHAFFMFRNADTNEINVVYRRKDGQYAVLEPEM